jgi:hypothetical protein
MAVCPMGQINSAKMCRLFILYTLNFCRFLLILAGIILMSKYPELNLILNCAGSSSAAAEDSVRSKREKDERCHSAPLPVATAATAKTGRSTHNSVISSVLQRAIVPRQEGEEKWILTEAEPPLPTTLQLIILVDPEQPALPPSGTAGGSLGNRIRNSWTCRDSGLSQLSSGN